MSTNPFSPLNDDHLQQIKNGLRALDVLDAQLLLAKQAKIDVSQQETEAKNARERLLALKNTYFPNSL